MLASGTGYEFDIARGPDWLIIKIRGIETATEGPSSLADQLWDLAQRHFTYRLVLDLDKVDLLGLKTIEQLVELDQRIRNHDGILRICGLSQYNRQALHECASADYFLPYETREEAVLGQPDPRLPR